MDVFAAARSVWWIIHKDVTRELRAHETWPSMVLLGVVTVFLIGVQLALPIEIKISMAGGLLWLSIFFAGTLALERSFAGERDSGCWQTLKYYPVAPSSLFLAKMAVNTLSIAILECVLVPTFMLFTDVPLFIRPLPQLITLICGTVCFASVGTLVSALTVGIRGRGGLLALLLLPLLTPVLLACSEATRIAIASEFDSSWSLYAQLLAVFAAVFTIAGAAMFEYVMEE